MTIGEARSPEEIDVIRLLFAEYQQDLGVDLSFQRFEEELAALPGAYAPPRGRLLLAVAGSEPAGCVGLWPLGEALCEMKRLYVRPSQRGTGLGRRLAEEVMTVAAGLGYQRMRLDTLPQLEAAIALYRSLGFRPIERYSNAPRGALFFEATLVP